MISIAMPTYESFGLGAKFLKFQFEKFLTQTYKDFEIVISDQSRDEEIKKLCMQYEDRLNISYHKNNTNRGSISHNTNNAIRNCSGELIKILFLDDFLWDETSLQKTVECFDDDTSWLATAYEHTNDGINFHTPEIPSYSSDILLGINTIGNPSVITMRNTEDNIYLDEKLTWVVDLDFYEKMFAKHGAPKILREKTVAIRLWDKQMTHIIPRSIKIKEEKMLRSRNAKPS